MIKEKEKTGIIKSNQTHDKDTGSVNVQVALLTERINRLSKHLEDSPKDHNSRRGLLMMVNQRRRLLDYLNSSDKDAYQALIKKLKLRK
jgi:small subunit ribosomal protein S15